MKDVELFNKVSDYCELHDIIFRYFPVFEKFGISPFLIIDKNGVSYSFSNIEEVCDYLEIEREVNK